MRTVDAGAGRPRVLAERRDRIAQRLAELPARPASRDRHAAHERARAQAWHDQATGSAAELRQQAAELGRQAAELRQQMASLAVSVARTEERVASTFEKIARNRPPREAARLLAEAGDARKHAHQERALAARYNRSSATVPSGMNLQPSRPPA